MRIVHLAAESNPYPEPKPKKLTKSQQELQSAGRWMAIQNQRNYRSALKEFAAEIAEIRKQDPTWMPGRD